MSPTPKARIGLLSWFFAWLLFCPAALALQDVTLGWTPSTDSSAVGSAVYYGTNSGTYSTRLDAGTNATLIITGLQEGVTYFFAVTAYDSSGQESVPSNEVSYQVPLTNSPPTVALTSPTAGSSYGAPASIDLAATVVSNGYTISEVQFYSGATLLGQSTSAPYGFSWNDVAAGSYSLTAVAVYDAGSTASSALVAITVTNPPPTVALTSPTAGSSYGAPASINLAATVVSNGHTISEVQFYSGATLLGQSTSAPYSFNWNNVAAGGYSLMAVAVYDAGSTAFSAQVAVTVTSLPPPWDNADVGTVGVAGSASESAGTFTVSGAGNISGSADDFQFVYQTLSGDGQIQARLNSVPNTGPNGCVAVMIRETLTSGSRYGLMGISPDGVFRFQYRNSTGNKTTSTTADTGAPSAVWVRLVRSNNLLSGYESTDGTTWTFVDSQNVRMASEVYVGLVVASGDPGVLNTSSFSNVDVLP
jgi:Bacterial Ig domain